MPDIHDELQMLRNANREQKARIATLEARLEALQGIVSLSSASTKTISNYILASIVRMTGSECGFYGLVGEDERTMTIYNEIGEEMRNCAMADKFQHLPISPTGICAEAIRRREPFILQNYAAAHEANPTKVGHSPEGHVPLTNLLVVPFFSHGKITAMAAVAKRETDFRQDDITQITALLNSVQAITDSRRAKETLRQDSLYTRSLIEASPDPLVTISPQGVITDVNRATEQATGLPREQLIGSDFSDYFTEPAKAREGYQEVIAKGSVRDYPLIIRHVSGSTLDVLYNAEVYRNEAGEIQGVFAAARDISARKRAEGALRESEERYRELFTEMTNGFAIHEIVCDNAGNAVDYVTLEVNVAFERLLAVPRAAVVGKRASETLPPEELHHWLGIFGPVALTGQSTHYVMYSALNQKHFEGTAYCPQKGQFVVTFIDITERKRAEEALRQSEARFRAIVEASPDAITFGDLEGRILLANPQAAALLGFESIDALLSVNFAELVVPEERLRALEDVQRTRTEGPVRHAEGTLLRRDGSRVRCEMSTAAIPGSDGAPTSLMAIICDISARKEAAQLRELEAMRLQAQLGLHKRMDASLDQLFDFTLEALTEATTSPIAFIGLLDRAETEVILCAMSKGVMALGATEAQRKHLIAHTALWGECVRQRQPVIVNTYADAPAKTGSPLDHVPLERYLAVPVFDGDRTVAVTVVANKAGDYTEADSTTLTLVTERLWDILRRQRAEEQLRQTHAELEQRVLARTTALAAANQTLRVDQERFRTVADYTYDWETWRGPDGRYRYVSPSCERISGYRPDEFYVDSGLIEAITHPDDRAMLARHRSIEFASAKPATFDMRITTRSGEERWLNHVCLPVYGADGSWLGRRTSYRDITARKRAEQAEREQRLWAEILRDTAAALSSSLDLDQVLDHILANMGRVVPHEFSQIMLRDADDGAGRVIRDGGGAGLSTESTPYDLAKSRALTHMVATGQPVLIADTSIEAGWADSPMYRMRSCASAPLRIRGQVIGFLTVGSRVAQAGFTPSDAERLLAFANQAAIAIENARLYQREQAQLRRLQESQARLVQAEKMSALGRLTASIAHEINNPLQAVRTGLSLVNEVLDESGNREEITQDMNIVREELERIVRIVGRLREFARPAREGLQPTDVSAVLANVLELVNKPLQHGGVTVERQWAPDLALVLANPDRLKQVFMNLIINAIDAMPRGGTLSIATTLDRMSPQEKQPALRLRIEFRDSGEGLAPEVQAHLFEPFVTTKPSGTGLGLSISYEIIRSMQGEITCASQPGVGTTFTIWLPVIAAAQPQVF